jgi:SAM-dependent methyltransferase
LLGGAGLASMAYGAAHRARYALDTGLRRRNRTFAKRSPDGLPQPPPFLAFLVGSSFDIERLYEQGRLGAQCIREVLRRHGYEIESMAAILDFGCGCGRVTRQWAALGPGIVYGTDYNELPIRWCREALSFARFDTNQLGPPLRYAADTFDLVYSISVLTHLTKELQEAWMAELARVLKPGGILYLTLHGETRKDELLPHDREAFDRGEMIVRFGRYSGENLCYVHHPGSYVREHLVGTRYDVLETVPGGARDANQDVWLLRKT